MAENQPPPYTVFMAMQACGLTEVQANDIAMQVFRNDFRSCKDKTDEDLRDSYKTFASFTQAQGQIRLNPMQKDNIKAFNQWVKDQFRLGKNPAESPFPLGEVTVLLERAKTHAVFVENKDSIAATAKPEKFSKDVKWKDWAPSFVNFLRAIPGRDGVPLKYVIRDNDLPDPTPNVDFLDDYVANAPLTGPSYATDAALVHTYLVNLTAQNNEAEALLKMHEIKRDGRKSWMALKSHYEGKGIFAIDLAQADHDLDHLFYMGEKRPHMYWGLFEMKLNQVFYTYVKREGRQVFSDDWKLRILLKKVRCEWLQPTKTSIEVEMARAGSSYSYEDALTAFRTEVNKKFPPGASETRNKRTIAELDRTYGNRNSGRGHQGGRGRSQYGRGGRHGGRNNNRKHKTRSDSRWITLKNGEEIEYHPSFKFASHVFAQFTKEQQETLYRERKEYKNRKNNSTDDKTTRMIEQLVADVSDLRSRASVPSSVSPNTRSSNISQVTSGTMFGGRNEQKMKRQKRNHDDDNDSG